MKDNTGRPPTSGSLVVDPLTNRIYVESTTLDGVADGTTYKRLLSTDISAGHIKLTNAATFDAGYDPSTKRRVFTTTPTTPYDIGDLWMSDSVVKRCSTARASGAYQSGDWTATTLDALADGLTYARLLTTDIQSGHIRLTSSGVYDVGYDPSLKRRVFTATPTTPYDVGDLWVDSSNTKRCTTQRLIGAYNSADWTATTIDAISDGSTYARLLTTDIQSGHIKLTSSAAFDVGYDPSTKRRVFVATPTTPYDIGDLWFDASVVKRCTTARSSGAYQAGDWTATTLDAIADGSTYAKLKATDIQSGYIKLTTNTVWSGKVTVNSGVTIDSAAGINIWGLGNALTTRATEAGTIQCYVGADGAIYAGGGKIKLNASGISIYETGNMVFYDSDNVSRGQIYAWPAADGHLTIISSASSGLLLYGTTYLKLQSADEADIEFTTDYGGSAQVFKFHHDGYLDMNTHRIKNITDPTDNQDAATKKWVSDNYATIGGAGITDIVQDLTPQLGGNLDPNTKYVAGSWIPSASNLYNLGHATAYRWKDFFFDGIMNLYTGAGAAMLEVSVQGGATNLNAASGKGLALTMNAHVDTDHIYVGAAADKDIEMVSSGTGRLKYNSVVVQSVISVSAPARSFGTVYQNTTDHTIIIVVDLLIQSNTSTNGIITVYSDSANPPTTAIAESACPKVAASSIAGYWTITFAVQPSHYYKVTNTQDPDTANTVRQWHEWT